MCNRFKKNIIYHAGDPDTRVYLRSSAKPVQAVALVSSGAMEKFNISLKELAVICSSHSGEDFHREAVSSILNKIRLSEDDLNCGVANPYNHPVEGYTEPEHPVQRLILKTISDILECKTEDITIGVDGYGVPTFMVTLHQAAYLYSLLAHGSDGEGKYGNSFGLIQKAMTTYPRMIEEENKRLIAQGKFTSVIVLFKNKSVCNII